MHSKKEAIVVKIFTQTQALELARIISIVEELDSALKQKLHAILEKLSRQRVISESLLEDFDRNKELRFRFTIAEGEFARDLLRKWKLQADLKEGEAIIVFNLPRMLDTNRKKPISKPKRLRSHQRYKRVVPRDIPWRTIYTQVKSKVWGHIGHICGKDQVYFVRLNEVGNHTDTYYYVWKIELLDTKDRPN